MQFTSKKKVAFAAAALAILRLDPLGKHGSQHSFGGMGGVSYAAIADFRALWDALERASKLAPTDEPEVFPLPASQAQLDRTRKVAAEAQRATGSSIDESDPRRKRPTGPATALSQHAFLTQLGEFIQRIANQ